MTDSVAGVFTGKYDASGKTVEQTLPGGVTMRQTNAPNGEAIARSYTLDGQSEPFFAGAGSTSVHGQLLDRSSLTVAANTYDAGGRLVKQATEAQDGSGACTLHTYTYNANGSRKSQASATGTTETGCPTSTGTATTHAYDSAGRIADAGYQYDTRGRLTASPDGLSSTLEPGSDILAAGHTVWGLALFVLLLAGLAAAVGRLTGRTRTAMAAVGGTPAALLLASYLTHEPDPDGFSGLWPTEWPFAAALMVAGAGLAASLARPDRTPDVLLADFRDRQLPVAAAAAAGLTAFFVQALASDAGPLARTVAAALSLAPGHGVGWVLSASGRGLPATAALTAAGVAVMAALDNAAASLWGWAGPDLLAWSATLAA
ncbi:hypothetical protein [Streptomyces sp. NPDC051211]|uniref:hypothetical protein n=1 Tax=Streptomyces sp. NPDC051211 TaxID=3154643 RepID=UPI00344B1F8B